MAVQNITREFLEIIKCPSKSVKNVNYLIVMPRTAPNEDAIYVFPLGIAYVSSALKASGRSVYTLNLNFRKDAIYKILKENITMYDIDVIATGGLSLEYHAIKEIIDIARLIKPNIISVVGGGLITSDPEAAMVALETADYGVIGQGEITINALAYAIEGNGDITTVKGVIYNDGTNWKVAQPQKELLSLDIIPYPDYDGFNYEELVGRSKSDFSLRFTSKSQDSHMIYMVFSRSCPFNCSFCFHSSGKKYVQRSLNSFFSELDFLLSKYKFNLLKIVDELFIKDENFITEFCKRIKKYNILWGANGRVDNTDRKILQTMKEAGCVFIQYGVESADNQILRSMRKHTTIEQVEDAFAICQELGILATGNLIFGDLEETKDTFHNSMKWYMTHSHYSIFLSWIKVLPGSHLYKVATANGTISDRIQYIKDGCPQINVSKMTNEEYWETVRWLEDFKTSTESDLLIDANLFQGAGGTVDVMGKCPVCNKQSQWNGFDPLMNTLVMCEKCNNKLRISLHNYILREKFQKNMEMMLKDKNVALCPATNRIQKLMELAPKLSNEKIPLIDLFKGKQDLFFGGKKVFPPDVIFDLNIDSIIVAIEGHKRTQIVHHIKNNYPMIKNIFHVSDFVF